MNRVPYIYKIIAAFTALCVECTSLSIPLARAEVIPQSAPSIKQINPELLKLPAKFGEVVESHAGVNGNVIVVQDAHAIPDAQKNIANVIKFMQKEYGVSTVALEGASGDLDPQIFRSFPDKKLLRDVMKGYMDAGEIAGGTAAAIFDESATKYQGVEDWDVYEEGLGLYLSAIDKTSAIEAQLSALREKLNKEKEAIYPRALLEVDREIERFYENAAQLTELIKVLGAIQAPEAGSELEAVWKEVSKQTKDNRLQTKDIEVRALAVKVEKVLKSPGAIKAFNTRKQEWMTGQISAEAFALNLKEFADQSGLSLEMSSDLLGMVRDQQTLKGLEGTKLFRDLEIYIREVKMQLTQTQQTDVSTSAVNSEMSAIQALDEKTNSLRILTKLSKLELSREEWTNLLGNLVFEAFAALGLKQEDFLFHLAFYLNAEERDGIFFKNLQQILESKSYSVKGTANEEQSTKYGLRSTDNRTAIIVAGGFHAEGITNRLKEAGMGYALVMPKINQIPENNSYKAQMRGEVSWKDYFEVENGRIHLYKAFVRATRDRLIGVGSDANVMMMKAWRDQIIRDLSDMGKVNRATWYTRYIDEVVDETLKHTDADKLIGKVDNFIRGLRGLEKSNQLTSEQIAALLKANMIAALKTAPAILSLNATAPVDMKVELARATEITRNIKQGDSVQVGNQKFIVGETTNKFIQVNRPQIITPDQLTPAEIDKLGKPFRSEVRQNYQPPYQVLKPSAQTYDDYVANKQLKTSQKRELELNFTKDLTELIQQYVKSNNPKVFAREAASGAIFDTNGIIQKSEFFDSIYARQLSDKYIRDKTLTNSDAYVPVVNSQTLLRDMVKQIGSKYLKGSFSLSEVFGSENEGKGIFPGWVKRWILKVDRILVNLLINNFASRMLGKVIAASVLVAVAYLIYSVFNMPGSQSSFLNFWQINLGGVRVNFFDVTIAGLIAQLLKVFRFNVIAGYFEQAEIEYYGAAWMRHVLGKSAVDVKANEKEFRQDFALLEKAVLNADKQAGKSAWQRFIARRNITKVKNLLRRGAQTNQNYVSYLSGIKKLIVDQNVSVNSSEFVLMMMNGVRIINYPFLEKQMRRSKIGKLFALGRRQLNAAFEVSVQSLWRDGMRQKIASDMARVRLGSEATNADVAQLADEIEKGSFRDDLKNDFRQAFVAEFLKELRDRESVDFDARALLLAEMARFQFQIGLQLDDGVIERREYEEFKGDFTSYYAKILHALGRDMSSIDSRVSLDPSIVELSPALKAKQIATKEDLEKIASLFLESLKLVEHNHVAPTAVAEQMESDVRRSELRIVGPEIKTEAIAQHADLKSDNWSAILDFLIRAAKEGKLKRAYFDLDNTVIKPRGFIGSEKQKEDSIEALKESLLRDGIFTDKDAAEKEAKARVYPRSDIDERRMIEDGFFMGAGNMTHEDLAKLRELKHLGVEIVVLTARTEHVEDPRHTNQGGRVKAMLQSIGINEGQEITRVQFSDFVDRFIFTSGGGPRKLALMNQDIKKHLKPGESEDEIKAQTIVVDDKTDNTNVLREEGGVASIWMDEEDANFSSRDTNDNLELAKMPEISEGFKKQYLINAYAVAKNTTEEEMVRVIAQESLSPKLFADFETAVADIRQIIPFRSDFSERAEVRLGRSEIREQIDAYNKAVEGINPHDVNGIRSAFALLKSLIKKGAVSDEQRMGIEYRRFINSEDAVRAGVAVEQGRLKNPWDYYGGVEMRQWYKTMISAEQQPTDQPLSDMPNMLKQIHASAYEGTPFIYYEIRRIQNEQKQGKWTEAQAQEMIQGVWAYEAAKNEFKSGKIGADERNQRMSAAAQKLYPLSGDSGHQYLLGRFRSDLLDQQLFAQELRYDISEIEIAGLTDEQKLNESAVFTEEDMSVLRANRYLVIEKGPTAVTDKKLISHATKQPYTGTAFQALIYFTKSKDVQSQVAQATDNLSRSLGRSGLSQEEVLDSILTYQRELMAIHPFADGNGRSIRLLIDQLFRRINLPPSLYPYEEDISGTENAMKDATMKGMRAYLAAYRELLKTTDSAPASAAPMQRSEIREAMNQFTEMVRDLDPSDIQGIQSAYELLRKILSTKDAVSEDQRLSVEYHRFVNAENARQGEIAVAQGRLDHPWNYYGGVETEKWYEAMREIERLSAFSGLEQARLEELFKTLHRMVYSQTPMVYYEARRVDKAFAEGKISVEQRDRAKRDITIYEAIKNFFKYWDAKKLQEGDDDITSNFNLLRDFLASHGLDQSDEIVKTFLNTREMNQSTRDHLMKLPAVQKALHWSVTQSSETSDGVLPSHDGLLGQYRSDPLDELKYVHSADIRVEGENRAALENPVFTLREMKILTKNPQFGEEKDGRTDYTNHNPLLSLKEEPKPFKRNGRTLKWIDPAGGEYFGKAVTAQIYYTPIDDIQSNINKTFQDFAAIMAKLAPTDILGRMDAVIEFQRRLVMIHPFIDGNGRTSRLLQDYLFAGMGMPPMLNPNENDLLMPKEESRDFALQGMVEYLQGYGKLFSKGQGEQAPEELLPTPGKLLGRDPSLDEEGYKQRLNGTVVGHRMFPQNPTVSQIVLVRHNGRLMMRRSGNQLVFPERFALGGEDIVLSSAQMLEELGLDESQIRIADPNTFGFETGPSRVGSAYRYSAVVFAEVSGQLGEDWVEWDSQSMDFAQVHPDHRAIISKELAGEGWAARDPLQGVIAIADYKKRKVTMPVAAQKADAQGRTKADRTQNTHTQIIGAGFVQPAVAPDTVIEYYDEDGNFLGIFLIERLTDGHLATPGGFANQLERAIQASMREAFEETGLSDIKPVRMLRLATRPGRDERSFIWSPVYLAQVKGRRPSAGDDAANVFLFKDRAALEEHLLNPVNWVRLVNQNGELIKDRETELGAADRGFLKSISDEIRNQGFPSEASLGQLHEFWKSHGRQQDLLSFEEKILPLLREVAEQRHRDGKINKNNIQALQKKMEERRRSKQFGVMWADHLEHLQTYFEYKESEQALTKASETALNQDVQTVVFNQSDFIKTDGKLDYEMLLSIALLIRRGVSIDLIGNDETMMRDLFEQVRHFENNTLFSEAERAHFKNLQIFLNLVNSDEFQKRQYADPKTLNLSSAAHAGISTRLVLKKNGVSRAEDFDIRKMHGFLKWLDYSRDFGMWKADGSLTFDNEKAMILFQHGVSLEYYAEFADLSAENLRKTLTARAGELHRFIRQQKNSDLHTHPTGGAMASLVLEIAYRDLKSKDKKIDWSWINKEFERNIDFLGYESFEQMVLARNLDAIHYLIATPHKPDQLSLVEYFQRYGIIQNININEQTVVRIAREVAEQSARQGVNYLELRFATYTQKNEEWAQQNYLPKELSKLSQEQLRLLKSQPEQNIFNRYYQYDGNRQSYLLRDGVLEPSEGERAEIQIILDRLGGIGMETLTNIMANYRGLQQAKEDYPGFDFKMIVILPKLDSREVSALTVRDVTQLKKIARVLKAKGILSADEGVLHDALRELFPDDPAQGGGNAERDYYVRFLMLQEERDSLIDMIDALERIVGLDTAGPEFLFNPGYPRMGADFIAENTRSVGGEQLFPLKTGARHLTEDEIKFLKQKIFPTNTIRKEVEVRLRQVLDKPDTELSADGVDADVKKFTNILRAVGYAGRVRFIAKKLEGVFDAAILETHKDGSPIYTESTSHAGEAYATLEEGLISMREAVNDLKANRLGHGIAAGTNPWELLGTVDGYGQTYDVERINELVKKQEELIQFLIQKGVAIEINVSSNLQTGNVPDVSKHPFFRLLQSGVSLVVGTDGLIVSNTSIPDEIVKAAMAFNMDENEVRQLIDRIASKLGIMDAHAILSNDSHRGLLNQLSADKKLQVISWVKALTGFVKEAEKMSDGGREISAWLDALHLPMDVAAMEIYVLSQAGVSSTVDWQNYKNSQKKWDSAKVEKINKVISGVVRQEAAAFDELAEMAQPERDLASFMIMAKMIQTFNFNDLRSQMENFQKIKKQIDALKPGASFTEFQTQIGFLWMQEMFAASEKNSGPTQARAPPAVIQGRIKAAVRFNFKNKLELAALESFLADWRISPDLIDIEIESTDSNYQVVKEYAESQGYKVVSPAAKPQSAVLITDDNDIAAQNPQSLLIEKPSSDSPSIFKFNGEEVAGDLIAARINEATYNVSGKRVTLAEAENLLAGRRVLAMTGFTMARFDKVRAQKFLKRLLSKLNPQTTALVMGTNQDGYDALILEAVQNYEKEHGERFLVVGVMPQEGFQWKPGNVDALVVHGKTWPDDTVAVLKLSDVVQRLGGGPFARDRTNQALKIGKKAMIAFGYGGMSSEHGVMRVNQREKYAADIHRALFAEQLVALEEYLDPQYAQSKGTQPVLLNIGTWNKDVEAQLTGQIKAAESAGEKVVLLNQSSLAASKEIAKWAFENKIEMVTVIAKDGFHETFYETPMILESKNLTADEVTQLLKAKIAWQGRTLAVIENAGIGSVDAQTRALSDAQEDADDVEKLELKVLQKKKLNAQGKEIKGDEPLEMPGSEKQAQILAQAKEKVVVRVVGGSPVTDNWSENQRDFYYSRLRFTFRDLFRLYMDPAKISIMLELSGDLFNQIILEEALAAGIQVLGVVRRGDEGRSLNIRALEKGETVELLTHSESLADAADTTFVLGGSVNHANQHLDLLESRLTPERSAKTILIDGFGNDADSLTDKYSKENAQPAIFDARGLVLYLQPRLRQWIIRKKKAEHVSKKDILKNARDLKLEQKSHVLELAFERSNQSVENYDPAAHLSDLAGNDRQIAKLLNGPNGGWEGGSVGEHTLAVARNFQLRLPALMASLSPDSQKELQKLLPLVRLMLLLHDIGKSKSPQNQHVETIKIVERSLKAWGFSENEIKLAKHLIEGDLLGSLVVAGSDLESGQVLTALRERAQDAQVSEPVYYALSVAYYMADSSSYPGVREAVFHEENGVLKIKKDFDDLTKLIESIKAESGEAFDASAMVTASNVDEENWLPKNVQSFRFAARGKGGNFSRLSWAMGREFNSAEGIKKYFDEHGVYERFGIDLTGNKAGNYESEISNLKKNTPAKGSLLVVMVDNLDHLKEIAAFADEKGLLLLTLAPMQWFNPENSAQIPVNDLRRQYWLIQNDQPTDFLNQNFQALNLRLVRSEAREPITIIRDVPFEDALNDLRVQELLKSQVSTDAFIFLSGGASDMAPEDQTKLLGLFDALRFVAERSGLKMTVGDGGTRAGIMETAGLVRKASNYIFDLIGIAPQEKIKLSGEEGKVRLVTQTSSLVLEVQEGSVTLDMAGGLVNLMDSGKDLHAIDPNHSHIITVKPRDPNKPRFGDETRTMGDVWGAMSRKPSPWLDSAEVKYEILKKLTQEKPSVNVLANGGGITLDELKFDIEQRRPTVLIKGSGRAADVLVDMIERLRRGETIEEKQGDDAATKLWNKALTIGVLQNEKLFEIFDMNDGAEALAQVLDRYVRPNRSESRELKLVVEDLIQVAADKSLVAAVKNENLATLANEISLIFERGVSVNDFADALYAAAIASIKSRQSSGEIDQQSAIQRIGGMIEMFKSIVKVDGSLTGGELGFNLQDTTLSQGSLSAFRQLVGLLSGMTIKLDKDATTEAGAELRDMGLKISTVNFEKIQTMLAVVTLGQAGIQNESVVEVAVSVDASRDLSNETYLDEIEMVVQILTALVVSMKVNDPAALNNSATAEEIKKDVLKMLLGQGYLDKKDSQNIIKIENGEILINRSALFDEIVGQINAANAAAVAA